MDNIRKLERSQKGFWTSEEISSILKLAAPSTSVFCSRSVKRGDLVRIKRGIYVIPGWLEKADERELFFVSNILETPSYVSLLSALSQSEFTTQIAQSSVEAISFVRTNSFETEGFVFRYHHLPRSLFFGFERQGGVFMAEPEKAFLDAAYLASLGRYALDEAALETDRFDRTRIDELLLTFPARTAEIAWRIVEGR
jgi:predicted transcriptional regulator of viral defense system